MRLLLICGTLVVWFVAQAKPITVCSLNVWGLGWGLSSDRAARMQSIVRTFAASDCDVINVQELFVQTDYEHLSSGLSRDGRYAHSRWFKSGLVGSGLATFSRTPLRRCSFVPFVLNGHFRQWLQGDWFAGKGLSVCLLRARDSDAGEIAIVNTHLIANYHDRNESDPYELHRLSQTLLIADVLDLLFRARVPFVLAGDFNYEQGDRAAELLAFQWVRNLGPTFNVRRTLYHDPRRPSEAIDHVVYGRLSLEGASVQFRNLSDHAGIRASFLPSDRHDKPCSPSRWVFVHMTKLCSRELEALGRDQSAMVRRLVLLAALLAMLFFLHPPGSRHRTQLALGLACIGTFAFAYGLVVSLLFIPIDRNAVLQLQTIMSDR